MADLSVESIIQAYQEHLSRQKNGVSNVSYSSIPMVFPGGGSTNFDTFITQPDSVSKFCDMLIGKGLIKTAQAPKQSGSTPTPTTDKADTFRAPNAKGISEKDIKKALKNAGITDSDKEIAEDVEIGQLKVQIEVLDKQAKKYKKAYKQACEAQQPTESIEKNLKDVLAQKANLEKAVSGYHILTHGIDGITGKSQNEILEQQQEAFEAVNALENSPKMKSIADAAWKYKHDQIPKLASEYTSDLLGKVKGGASAKESTEIEALDDIMAHGTAEEKEEAAKIRAQKIANSNKKITDILGFKPQRFSQTKEEIEQEIAELEKYPNGVCGYDAQQVKEAIKARRDIIEANHFLDNKDQKTKLGDSKFAALKDGLHKKDGKTESEAAWETIKGLSDAELIALLRNREQRTLLYQGRDFEYNGLYGAWWNDEEAMGLIIKRLIDIRQKSGANMNGLQTYSGLLADSYGDCEDIWEKAQKDYNVSDDKAGSGFNTIIDKYLQGFIYDDQYNPIERKKIEPKIKFGDATKK